MLSMYYWPRLIFGFIFALFNSFILLQRVGKKNLLFKGIILFVISPPVVSVVTEILSGKLYALFIGPVFSWASVETSNAVFMLYSMFSDIISFILPIYIYTRLARDSYIICATTYLQYAVIDRLCMILSVSAVTYLIVLVICLTMVTISFRNVGKIIVGLDNPAAWRPVLHYVFGLFFLLDVLNGAYYIFPGIVRNEISVSNIWIGLIAVVSTIYLGSFLRLNLMAYQEQAQRLIYMNELRESHNNIIMTFAQISEEKSGETGQHVKRVSEYSAVIAESYGLTEDEINLIRTASMMHDFGKLLIPNEIVEKPGELTEEEMEIMKKHTIYGHDILSSSKGDVMDMARVIAYQHHEKFDGTGYPRGISGEEVSVYAQIVSLADVYDALTSKRAYKEAWSPKDSYDEIIKQKGRHFNPEVVDAFCNCYEQIEAIRKEFSDTKK